MNIDLVSLDSIFEVSHGNKFDFNKMVKVPIGEQSIAFVTRSRQNNGLGGFVKKVEDIEPYESGLITVALGGSTLSSFVQPRPFYTGQNIDILHPRFAMSLDVKLYYCLCIEANRFRYSTYGREANRTLHTIEVPALDQIPAWVNDVSKTAITEFCNKLVGLVETE